MSVSNLLSSMLQISKIAVSVLTKTFFTVFLRICIFFVFLMCCRCKRFLLMCWTLMETPKTLKADKILQRSSVSQSPSMLTGCFCFCFVFFFWGGGSECASSRDSFRVENLLNQYWSECSLILTLFCRPLLRLLFHEINQQQQFYGISWR